jgi:hypothetical protein
MLEVASWLGLKFPSCDCLDRFRARRLEEWPDHGRLRRVGLASDDASAAATQAGQAGTVIESTASAIVAGARRAG